MSITNGSSAQVLKPAQPSNPKLSPLLSLPAELRNQIYSYVFTEPVYTFRLGLSRDGDYMLRPLFRAPGWIGLTMTCRQIHTEAVFLPFEHGIFQVINQIRLVLLLNSFKKLPKSEVFDRLEIRTLQDVSYMTMAEAMTYEPPVGQTIQVRMVSKSRAGE